MKKSLALQILILFSLIFPAACEKKIAGIEIKCLNESGGDVTKFNMNYGSGIIEYEVFGNNYSYSKIARVPTIEQVIAVEYYDDQGQRYFYDLSRKLLPDMNGGTLWFTLQANGTYDLRFDFPK
jgi:hypothetical protein